MKNHYSPKILRKGARWQDLRLYKKADAIYQLTVSFCQRFLPPVGDRTVDQMVQAARSGKQNIVEGSEDGKTSTEMELKLINVARASIGELREDYKDYAHSHNLAVWEKGHPRYQQMQDYTKNHNTAEEYMPYAEKWSAEEYCNVCLTLCYQLDSMINHYLSHLQDVFIEEGGIKERMYAARTGYRNEQDNRMTALEKENASLKNDIEELRHKYDDLKNRAVEAYRRLEAELKEEREKHKQQ